MRILHKFVFPEPICGNCTPTIENALFALKTIHVKYVNVDSLNSHLLTVELTEKDPPADPIAIIIEELSSVGFDVLPYHVPNVTGARHLTIATRKNYSFFSKPIKVPVIAEGADNPPPLFSDVSWRLIKGGSALLLGLGFLAVSIFCPVLPVAATVLLTLFSAGSSLFFGKEILSTALNKIVKSGTLDMNSLFSLSALTAILLSLGALFISGLPAMLDAALLIFGFRHLGIAIEMATHKTVMRGLNFRQYAPRKIKLKIADNFYEERDIENINVGAVILVPPGGVIPLNGKNITDSAVVLTTIKSGNNFPEVIQQGENLLAGMEVAKYSKNVEIEVTANEDNSFLVALDNKIQEAKMEKAPLETSARKILKYFIPALLATAAGMGLVVGALISPVMAVACVATLLVAACPCTLGSIIPIAVTVGIAKGIREKVQFKSGKALQSAGEIDTVVFDLNGTLTQGKYRVNAFKLTAPNCDYKKILACVLKLQNESSHPISFAIKRYLKKFSTQYLLPTDVLEYTTPVSHQPGEQCVLNGNQITIGNQTMMRDANIDTQEYAAIIKNSLSEHVIFIAENKKIIGYFTVNDPIRKNARYVIQELRHSGKQVHICTGTDLATASRYAEYLNVPARYVHANCIPIADPLQPHKIPKSTFIEKLQQQGRKVAMIGDAENDTIPFISSDLSILVKSSASKDKIQEEAGVTIEKSSLLPILAVFAIGSSAISTIKKNMMLTMTYNIVTIGLVMGLTLGLGFVLNPGVGVALMILQASFIMYQVYQYNKQKMPEAYQKLMAQEDADNEVVHNNTLLHEKMQPVLANELAPQGLHTAQIISYPVKSAKVYPLPENTQMPCSFPNGLS